MDHHGLQILAGLQESAAAQAVACSTGACGAHTTTTTTTHKNSKAPVAAAAGGFRDWSRLPDDLLRNVLARLPVHSVFRARAACRAWAAADAASSAHAAAAEDEECYFPVLAVTTTHPGPGGGAASLRCCALDQASRTWRSMPPLTAAPAAPPRPGPGPPPPAPTVVAGHRGLVLLLRHPVDLCVANPVTRTATRLPPLHAGGGGLPFFSGAACLRVSRRRRAGSSAFQVYLFMDHPLGGAWAQPGLPGDAGFARVQAYDSRRPGAWTPLRTGPTFHRAVFASPDVAVAAAADDDGGGGEDDHHGGSTSTTPTTFFLLVRDLARAALWVAAFHLRARQWSHARVPGGLDRRRTGNLVHCDGRLLLVGWTLDLGRYLVVYGLAPPQARDWTIVTFLPPGMDDVLAACDREGVRVVAHGHVLCITTLESLLVVAYDLRRSSWHRWPSPPTVVASVSASVRPMCFAYQPSFASFASQDDDDDDQEELESKHSKLVSNKLVY